MYQEEQKLNLVFENFQVHPDKSIEGWGEDMIGHFWVEGQLTLNAKGESVVTFEKQYDQEENLNSSQLSTIVDLK